jgi:hypothetical protein
MRVQLTRKLAQFIDGVDLTHHEVGDVFDVNVADARLLLAEGWAEVQAADSGRGEPGRANPRLAGSGIVLRAEAADRASRADRPLDRIRQAQSRLAERRLTQTESRRAEDRVREELRDARSHTVNKSSSKR